MKPTHTAFTTREYTDKATGEVKTAWTAIGVAFAHRDFNGFKIVLDALPINGQIELRYNEEKTQEG